MPLERSVYGAKKLENSNVASDAFPRTGKFHLGVSHECRGKERRRRQPLETVI
jgi:hypothetical protein